VPSDDILVSEVVKVSAGDRPAADALFIRRSKLKTNESFTTSEVADIFKDPVIEPFMLSGTTVFQGVGFIPVIAIGESSQWSIILASLTVDPEHTPLQVRLNRLTTIIGTIGILFAVLIFVVAISEGLLLPITLGLAFAMRKMMTKKYVVRRLEACETMGSSTQLNAEKRVHLPKIL
jgi:P-type Ca2+ transporter type 2C